MVGNNISYSFTLNKKKRMFRYLFIFFIATFLSVQIDAQVRGGASAFEYLRLSQSPHVTALGGLAVVHSASDVMMATSNPALLRPEFHTALGINYNVFYADTKGLNLYYAHHSEQLNTTFGVGVQYINYGDIILANDLGQILGNGRAADYAITVSASKSYLKHWRYGAHLKFAGSKLVDKNAAAILADVGVVYADTSSQWYVGMAAKNVGYQINKYYNDIANQPLPLDLQIGIMKRFAKAPFSISVLAHHLNQWNIYYDNPADRQSNLFIIDSAQAKEPSNFGGKLLRHFVFALDVNLGKRLEISAGYNFMRRAELGLDELKGISGFSYGAGLYLNKITVHYARSHYHLAGAYNQIGFNFQLNQFMGLGNFGKKINWSSKYAEAF